MSEPHIVIVTLALALAGILIPIVIKVVRDQKNLGDVSLYALGRRVGVTPRSGASGITWQSLTFEADGIEGELYLEPGLAKVRFAWQPPGKMSLHSQRTVFKAPGFGQDIEVGNPSFDKEFIVQGEPREWLLSMLNADQRNRIRKLCRINSDVASGEDFRLVAGPAGISFVLHRSLQHDEPAQETMLRESIAFLRCMGPRMDDAVWVSPSTETATSGLCPVCAQGLGDRAIKCTRCSMLHHPDCWSFVGGCVVFGCRGSMSDDASRPAST